MLLTRRISQDFDYYEVDEEKISLLLPLPRAGFAYHASMLETYRAPPILSRVKYRRHDCKPRAGLLVDADRKAAIWRSLRRYTRWPTGDARAAPPYRAARYAAEARRMARFLSIVMP